MSHPQSQNAPRGFAASNRRLLGHVPTIAITPVADGRASAYEQNFEPTWNMVRKVQALLADNIFLPDGTPINIVTAPEIVYGARTGAIAQEYYARMGVTANIWVSRSWAYSDELMSACQGIGSSEWQQAAYGLNQTDRPGAVWLKAFCAAMDEKMRPIFAIYNPDLEDESGPIAPYVAERLLRFARCAAAIAEMRGKNYLSVGGVSMGIIGSDVRRNTLLHYFGMGTVSVDMVAIRGRMDNNFFDQEELQRALDFLKGRFRLSYNKPPKPYADDDLLRECLKMTLIVRDMMQGNAKLAQRNVEQAQGYNAIASGTQGQRAWTDLYPNFDMTESLLNSSFDWNGYRPPYIVATENDSKNAMGMLAAHLLSGLPQLFADIRTNWTPDSVRKTCGVDISAVAPNGFIDKRNSGAGALDYSIDPYALLQLSKDTPVQHIARLIRETPELQDRLQDEVTAHAQYKPGILEYFLGDGLSSSFRTPGGIPMTAYRYNMVGEELSCSIVEGDTINLPDEAANTIGNVTDPTWPETFWAPRNMSSFDYMRRIGPNHDGNSYGNIGADLITLNAMLRIPVDLHNIDESNVFRPTLWDRFASDDFRVCTKLGPLYR